VDAFAPKMIAATKYHVRAPLGADCIASPSMNAGDLGRAGMQGQLRRGDIELADRQLARLCGFTVVADAAASTIDARAYFAEGASGAFFCRAS
jgi:hypothetical protein